MTDAGMGVDLQGLGTSRRTGTSRNSCRPQDVGEVHGLEISRGSVDMQRRELVWVTSLHSGGQLVSPAPCASAPLTHGCRCQGHLDGVGGVSGWRVPWNKPMWVVRWGTQEGLWAGRYLGALASGSTLAVPLCLWYPAAT